MRTPKITRNAALKFSKASAVVAAITIIIYTLWIYAIASFGSHNFPSDWSPDLGQLNFSGIYQTIGLPQDNACDQQYQNWVEERWWGRYILKIISSDCDANSRPAEIWAYTYAKGRYLPVHIEILYDEETATNEPKTHERISPFLLGNLPDSQLREMAERANKGDCDLAEKLGDYHFYASLDLVQAEKYYRIAATCGRPNSLTGLIAILRDPTTDREVDGLVKTLANIDKEQGEAAAQEIALRRAERAMKRPDLIEQK